ncbi:MAG: hypothetical protein ACO3NY_01810 [Poseidonia sp.]
MNRVYVLVIVTMLLVLPSMGSANPNGVGSGSFDAQCGGACHGDADMNRSSAATVEVSAPDIAYEGLLTSVSITVTNIETTTSGLLGFFLLSDLSGAGDTPSDAGWTIVSNSEGGTGNYVEARIGVGQNQHTVEWTVRAPSIGEYPLYGAIHHGTEDGSEAPFFGASASPAVVDVRPVPEDLPRLAADFEPPALRTVGEATTVMMTTAFVDDVQVEWRLPGGEATMVTVASDGDAWSFELPATLQPVAVQWRAHLAGEGPDQTTPWFTLQSEEARWSVDENAAYLQSLAMVLAFMAAFLSLQRGRSDEGLLTKDDVFDEEVEA